MSFAWLKRYLPRGLYARAALILVFPVATLQIVVSLVFIQRHFEGVTAQMTGGAMLDLAVVVDADAPARQLMLANSLEIGLKRVAREAVPGGDERRWFDFSGREVIATLRSGRPAPLAIALPDDRRAVVFYADPLAPEDALRLTVKRRRLSARNPHQLLVNMVFFSVLMTLISFVYMRNQLRPIKRLARAAEAFGRGQTLPYHPSGATEVRAAGNAFLHMRGRIERQIEQRTMMLSGVSHDLRTPLTRLRLGLSMLEEEERAGLERDVEDMQRLLDGFLNFAKGMGDGEPELVAPGELAAKVVEDVRGAIRDADIQLNGGPLGLEAAVWLRPLAVERALENLITNAVRYGGQAEVSVVVNEKTVVFRVEDAGPGIPADQREEALKPFARLDPARNQNKITGVGLGLAIAADVARAHGGVLRLGQSPSLGGLRADLVIAR